MFNPSREIFEMDFRQQDLERELEQRRLVRAAQPQGDGLAHHLWSQLRYGWHVLSRLRKINVAISIDIDEPCVDVAG